MEQIFGGGILWTLLIGFVAGLLARAIKPGDDKLNIIWTIVLGVAGALLARFAGGALGWYEPGDPAGFIASVVGAIILLFIYGLGRKRGPDLPCREKPRIAGLFLCLGLATRRGWPWLPRKSARQRFTLYAISALPRPGFE